MQKEEQYKELALSLDSLLRDSPSEVSLLANASAMLFQTLPSLNWAGFYLLDEEGSSLILGPFQGKVACQVLRVGKGVCGTAIQEDRILSVGDVHSFSGHIACDPDSRSEIVLPLYKNGKPYGVLDIDSPILNRFDTFDEQGLLKIAEVINANLSRFEK